MSTEAAGPAEAGAHEIEGRFVDLATAWASTGVAHLTGHADGPALLPPGTAPIVADELARRVAESAALGGVAVASEGARLFGQRSRHRALRRAGRTSAGGSSRLIPHRDGWIVVSAAREDDAWLLAAAVGTTIAEPVVPWDAIATWAAQRDADEISEVFETLGITGAPVRPAPWQDAAEPSALRGVPAEVRGRVARPVAGLRVVDFSAMWAGPLAAWLLGRAGAQVTTIESATRPDGSRRGDPRLHAELHAGHDLRVVDPDATSDRAMLRDLVGAADIVIEASRPRALRAWGLDAEAHAQRGGTWVSITAAGRGSARVGFGDDVAAAAGLLATDDAGGPVFVGDAIADPLTGLTAAALAASATDGGVLWDCSMTAIVAATLGSDAFRGPTRQPSAEAAR
ncbi:CoA transferase [Microbacterium sp. zg-Y818]|uniref:CoA transferase n=1 Tax=unclassified Microbacterium TaxID=2609290 RepID=UPI00214B9005|nr:MULTISPECIES: CoA transferase [unclassified Microbacterium]MCR2799359.1 CoA transferase [Microbacterium sp. zg.Y818]WIM21358.1 CoA transferase [Microbacterium sp. zg-Y818]